MKDGGLLEKIGEVFRRLSILDNLEDQLAYPPELLKCRQGQLKSLPEYYRLSKNPWDNVPRPRTTPQNVENIAWAIVNFEDYDVQILDLLEFEKELEVEVGDENPWMPQAYANYIDSGPLRDAIAQKIMLLHYIAPLSFGKSFNTIMLEAEDGDEQALLKLAQLDKSSIYGEWFKQFVIHRQYEGDWDFFKRLGRALAKPPLSGNTYWHKSVLVVAYFWTFEFQDRSWTIANIFKLLKDQGILSRQEKLAAFRVRLNRAGLKKPLHNKK